MGRGRIVEGGRFPGNAKDRFAGGDAVLPGLKRWRRGVFAVSGWNKAALESDYLGSDTFAGFPRDSRPSPTESGGNTSSIQPVI